MAKNIDILNLGLMLNIKNPEFGLGSTMGGLRYLVRTVIVYWTFKVGIMEGEKRHGKLMKPSCQKQGLWKKLINSLLISILHIK